MLNGISLSGAGTGISFGRDLNLLNVGGSITLSDGANFTIGSVAANAAGTVILTGGYAGSVDLGGGALPTSGDTFLVAFDPTHQYKWSRTVSVGANHRLMGAASACGFMIATDSDSVDFGQGPLYVSVLGSVNIGVAALGL